MKKPILLLVGAETTLLTTGVLFAAVADVWNALVGVSCVLGALAIVGWLVHTPRRGVEDRIVGIGTVCDESETTAGGQQVMVEVTSVDGDTFVGRLARHDGDPAASWPRPGTVLLVAFDPASPEHLSMPDDVLAVRAADLISV